jgi:sugar phosphate isomerase/epimerase
MQAMKGMGITMEFGVQIFGCLAECKKNPDAFFRAIAEAGYKQIEPCVLFDEPLKMLENARIVGNEFMEKLIENIWKPDELPEYIQLMEKYGLKLSSVHVFANNINQSMDKMIDTALKNNINAYIVNCNQQTISLEYEAFANECSNLALALKEHGIELWIHNNGTELKTIVEHNGKRVPVLSAILDLCKKANVGAQIDVGWVLYGGIDPIEYLLDVKEYIRSIHFKDLKKDFAARKDGDIFACLGDGALNVKEILECIPQLGSSIMEDMIKSYQILREAAITVD